MGCNVKAMSNRKEDHIMKKYKYLAAVLGVSMVLTMAGCGKKEAAVEETPTPEATAAPTEVPVTVTPVPTSTPAPKIIGVKTAQAKFVYLTNSLSSDLREVYLMVSGGEDWGKNLIPSESSVKAAEQVQMYYTPSEDTSSESTDSEDTSEDSTESTSYDSSALYDMKIVTADGDTYEIYSIDLGDMEKATLTMDQDTSSAYLRYMSLSAKKEMDTRDNSQQTSDDESSDDSSSDDSSSDDSSYDDSSYDDSSYDDSSYDDSSYDDSGYDDSSDDDGSYGDGSYDDGSYDDGSYDDGSDDDGNYDDGGYVEDDGSNGYDTDEY